MRNTLTAIALLLTSFALTASSQTIDKQKPTLLWSTAKKLDLTRGIVSHTERYFAKMEGRRVTLYDLKSDNVIWESDSLAWEPDATCAFDPMDLVFYYLTYPKYAEREYIDTSKSIRSSSVSVRGTGRQRHDSVYIVPGKIVLHRWSLLEHREIGSSTFDSYFGRFGLGPSGNRLYEVDNGPFLRIIDTRSGAILRTSGTRTPPLAYDPYGGGCRIAGTFSTWQFCQESNDEKYAALRFSEDSLLIYRISDASLVHARKDHRGGLLALNFQKDRLNLLSWESLEVVDLKSGDVLRTTHHVSLSRACNLNEHTFAAVLFNDYRSRTDSVVVLDTKTNAVRFLATISHGLTFRAFLQRSQRLLLENEGFGVALNLGTGIADTMSVTRGWLSELFFSKPHHSLYATGSYGASWVEYELPQGRVIDIEPQQRRTLLDISTAGDQLFRRYDTIFVVEAATGLRKVISMQGDGIRSAKFSPDGKSVVICMIATEWKRDGNTSRITRNESVAEITSIADTSKRMTMNNIAWYPRITFFPDLRHVLISGKDTLEVRTVGEDRPEHLLVGHTSPIEDVVISNDGGWLASRNHNGRLFIWRLRDSSIKGVFNSPPESYVMKFSPNNRYLLLSGVKGITPIDMHSGEQLEPVAESPLALTAVAFSDDGREFATGDKDAMVKMYKTPESWLVKEDHPIALDRTFLPLRFFVPNDARVALDNGKPFPYPRTDVQMEVLDKDHKLVVSLINSTLHHGWHIWEWDATDQPKGTYYMHATIGGVEHEERYELN